MAYNSSSAPDFKEIGHCGGKVTLTFSGAEGRRGYGFGYTGSGGFMAMTAFYVLPPGIPVAGLRIGGVGQRFDPPPYPGCIPVFVMSDSEGLFGHSCAACGGYWRSGSDPHACPYCRMEAGRHQFLSTAQLSFVRRYVDKVGEGLRDPNIKEIVIDLDAVADAVGKEGEKPDFYTSEESQQNKYTCVACDTFNDVRGRFAYCCACGTRNDIVRFRDEVVPASRKRLNAGDPPEDCVRDAVSNYEIMLGKLAGELARLVPMIESRRVRLTERLFHKVEEVRQNLDQWFGFDIGKGLKPDEWSHVVLMFHRRHVYEHKGEVDQKYLDDSGDTTVRLGQIIREEKEATHRLLGSLLRMAKNLQDGFHEVIPPIAEPIEHFNAEKARKEAYWRQQGLTPPSPPAPPPSQTEP
jgi:hypothetical protein